MYLIFVVLKQTALLEEILEKFYLAGVTGSTIIDSLAVEKGLFNSNSLLKGLRSFFKNDKNESKIIFTVVEDEALIRQIVSEIESIMEAVQENEKTVLVIPLHRVKGTLNQLAVE